MTTPGRDRATEERQVEKLADFREALYRELARFRPSSALEQMNRLLSTVPVDLRHLGKAIENDQRLAAEAVRLANSSLFGLTRPVSSLEQAVVATDAEIVRTLLLTSWLTRLSGSNIAPRENRLFWSHSLLAAHISRRISEWTGLVQPEQAFLAGLLHDIGHLPFLTLLARDETVTQRDVFNDLGEFPELQRHHFGIDHCELGARLATAIDFPHPLVEVVAKHHQVSLPVFRFPLLPIVGAAESITHSRHLSDKQELPCKAMGTLITNSLEKWLPGLNPSASRHLVEALELDLLAESKGPGSEVKKAWSESLPSSVSETRSDHAL